jgi:hypothetical protein
MGSNLQLIDMVCLFKKNAHSWWDGTARGRVAFSHSKLIDLARKMPPFMRKPRNFSLFGTVWFFTAGESRFSALTPPAISTRTGRAGKLRNTTAPTTITND